MLMKRINTLYENVHTMEKLLLNMINVVTSFTASDKMIKAIFMFYVKILKWLSWTGI